MIRSKTFRYPLTDAWKITSYHEKEDEPGVPYYPVGEVLELQAAAMYWLESQQTCVYLSLFEFYTSGTLTWLLEFLRFYQLHTLVLFCYEAENFLYRYHTSACSV